ncbi:MAG TPA: ABC transporter substrate-binding protein [Actinomycetota bacterium]|nr:ABC transporter substrate-binding protein [Actinomycetota bacterium]
MDRAIEPEGAVRSREPFRGRLVALTVVVVVTAACTADVRSQRYSSSSSPEPWRGGTLRLALVEDFWAKLDPQMSYAPVPWEIFRCCLLRTLYSYNGLPASEGGVETRPDLATAAPEIAPDGLTWTIHIKKGIHYAPPLDEFEIVAGDFVRALLRTGWHCLRRWTCSEYASYYSVIEGFDAYVDGRAEAVSGIETPDDHTLVFHLTEPAGDLPNRLALAATAPIPPNPHAPDAVLGAAEGHDDGYGRFLVASGPYMIEGSEDLDLSVPPEEQDPIAGYSPPETAPDDWTTVLRTGSLALVRNPSWDASTDDLRRAYADRIEVEMHGRSTVLSPPSILHPLEKELSRALETGAIDFVFDLPYTERQMARYRGDPRMRDRITVEPFGVIYYVLMNLAVPPFDDVHVRRAVAMTIDEAALVRAQGEDAAPMTHMAPDAIEAYLLAAYDPYPTSFGRARSEMALSAYDEDGDGRCDARVCDAVLALVGDWLGRTGVEEIVTSLAAIGIDLRVDVDRHPGFYRRVGNEREAVPFSVGWNWVWDYPNASTVIGMLFDSSSITLAGSPNATLIGASDADLRRWGYDVTDVPTVDGRIDRCNRLTGGAQTECWAELDRYLMERVVPQIPYLGGRSTFIVSGRVADFSYDASIELPALDRMALDPGSV